MKKSLTSSQYTPLGSPQFLADYINYWWGSPHFDLVALLEKFKQSYAELTQEKPTEPGYYWYQREYETPYIENVFIMPTSGPEEAYAGQLCTGGGCQECMFFTLVSDMEGRWSKKLPLPPNPLSQPYPEKPDDVPF